LNFVEPVTLTAMMIMTRLWLWLQLCPQIAKIASENHYYFQQLKSSSEAVHSHYIIKVIGCW